jgi:hypothetical protein
MGKLAFPHLLLEQTCGFTPFRLAAKIADETEGVNCLLPSVVKELNQDRNC